MRLYSDSADKRPTNWPTDIERKLPQPGSSGFLRVLLMWELNAEGRGLLRVMAATRISSPVNRHRPALRVAIGLVLKKKPSNWAGLV